MATVDTAYWCERVQTCFSLFLTQPSSLQHLLLFGPPGSGKTTSAAWLVDKIWGDRQSLMCISMNAADERSLESIRQKVFPFLTVDWRMEGETAPRFLILDECETLTEAAQLSLQTILNTDPSQLCVILICNSQSRIHPKLRQRLLKIRFDPPNAPHAPNAPSASPPSKIPTSVCDSSPDSLFTILTRGDLRQREHQVDTEQRIWNYLHAHPSELPALIRQSHVDYPILLTEILLLADLFHIIDQDFLDRLNALYPFLTDATYLHNETETRIVELLREFKDKIERAYQAK